MPVFHVEPAQPRSSSSPCWGRASVVTSRSPGTRAAPCSAASSASRTDPPTRCTSKPAWVNRRPSSVSTGERSTSARTVSWTAGGTGSPTARLGGVADTTSQSSGAPIAAWSGSAPAARLPGLSPAPHLSGSAPRSAPRSLSPSPPRSLRSSLAGARCDAHSLSAPFLAAMLPGLSPDSRYPAGMAGTGGRGRPGRRLRRVDETSAGGLVVADDGVTGPRAALIGRTDRRGRLLWSLPKGHIEAGETPEDTAVREVAEETGIIGEVVAPLGIIDFWFVADGRRVHKTVHHFLLRAIGGALSDADIEVTEVAWVPLDELSGRLAYADERALVERAPALLADTA